MHDTLLAAAPLLDPAATVHALGPDWLQADTLIERFGTHALVGIVLVVFIETGLLFPFLPGDSLLFTAGMLVAQDTLDFPLWLLCTLLFLAAFGGDQVAYLIGNRAGPRIFSRPDSRIFRRSHIEKTNAYFERYGGRTIILARFVPIVRTYAPVAAGIGGMSYRHFVSYNVIGAALWGVGVTLLGYALGGFSFVHDNIETILVAIVLVSVLPMIVEVVRGWLTARREAAAGAGAGTVVADVAVADLLASGSDDEMRGIDTEGASPEA